MVKNEIGRSGSDPKILISFVIESKSAVGLGDDRRVENWLQMIEEDREVENYPFGKRDERIVVSGGEFAVDKEIEELVASRYGSASYESINPAAKSVGALAILHR